MSIPLFPAVAVGDVGAGFVVVGDVGAGAGVVLGGVVPGAGVVGLYLPISPSLFNLSASLRASVLLEFHCAVVSPVFGASVLLIVYPDFPPLTTPRDVLWLVA